MNLTFTSKKIILLPINEDDARIILSLVPAQPVQQNSTHMKRRDIIQNLSVLPFAGSFLSVTSAASAAEENGPLTSGPLSIGPNIYESIGVDPVINCRGTFTII